MEQIIQHFLLVSFIHKLFLEEGEVLMCGQGTQGQLGIGYLPQKEYNPVKALVEEKILQVSCGDMHTGFLSGMMVIIIHV